MGNARVEGADVLVCGPANERGRGRADDVPVEQDPREGVALDHARLERRYPRSENRAGCVGHVEAGEAEAALRVCLHERHPPLEILGVKAIVVVQDDDVRSRSFGDQAVRVRNLARSAGGGCIPDSRVGEKAGNDLRRGSAVRRRVVSNRESPGGIRLRQHGLDGVDEIVGLAVRRNPDVDGRRWGRVRRHDLDFGIPGCAVGRVASGAFTPRRRA